MFHYTPLHYAAINGHLSVVEYLVCQGADYREGIQGESFLHWASSLGHLSVVECLVNQKADINAKTKDVELSYLKKLFFIWQLKMVILVLLNIWLITKLIQMQKIIVLSFYI